MLLIISYLYLLACVLGLFLFTPHTARQLDCMNIKFKILHIQLEDLPSESFLTSLNMTRPVSSPGPFTSPSVLAPFLPLCLLSCVPHQTVLRALLWTKEYIQNKMVSNIGEKRRCKDVMSWEIKSLHSKAANVTKSHIWSCNLKGMAKVSAGTLAAGAKVLHSQIKHCWLLSCWL